ncbi:MAG: nucleotidyltransferase domain-containing protein [Acidimicrobiales bacterium]
MLTMFWAYLTAWRRQGLQRVDGGWGVDALIGEQTRGHDDLDLVVDAGAVDDARRLLCEEGFAVSRDWLPTAIAFSHLDGRAVDLHPIEPTPDGGGDQVQLDRVRRWHYAPPVTGLIAGRDVACCSLETQIAEHLGYGPDGADHADMKALAERFGCDLPGPYSARVTALDRKWTVPLRRAALDPELNPPPNVINRHP